MNLLPNHQTFKMPPFVRLNFVSKSIKDKWEPKIRKAREVHHRLELLTVQKGLRRATTNHFRPEQLDKVTRDYLEVGLTFSPIRRTRVHNGVNFGHPPVVQGQPWDYYGVIARDPKDAAIWAKAEPHDGRYDHKTIGELLGYPTCCVEAFEEHRKNGYLDPAWQQAEDSPYVKRMDEHRIVLSQDMPWYANTLLRNFGLSVIPHIPCSHGCGSTVKMAEEWLELAREEGLEGLEELQQILSMPMSWNALKGIAIVSTPIFKMTVNSVVCYPNYEVQYEGTYYPEDKEIPRGLKFPWRVPPKVNKINELRRLQAEGKIPVLQTEGGLK